MLSINIFKNTEIIKYMMVNIKLHIYWHYVCHNSEKFLDKVQCLFAFCSVHACKHLTQSCAIQGYPVQAARADVYRARRYCLGDLKKSRSWNVACMGDMKNTYKVSVDISEGWWFKRRREDSINMDRKEVGCDDMNWGYQA